jgi:four helix bundle protein
MKIYLDHEKLKVYHLSLEFIEVVDQIISYQTKKTTASENLERASTSITLNIAEGNGRFTSRDRCNFFDIARGSALESAGCLDILYKKKFIFHEELIKGKELLSQIVSMIIGLIKSNSDRTYEVNVEYKILSDPNL